MSVNKNGIRSTDDRDHRAMIATRNDIKGRKTVAAVREALYTSDDEDENQYTKLIPNRMLSNLTKTNYR